MSNTNTSIQKACCAQPQQSDARSEWSYTPAIDVYEVADAYVIECDAPGVSAQSVDLTFEKGVLHLHAAVPQRHAQSANFLVQEYGVGDFDRQIPLGRIAEFVDVDRSEAEYSDGVLTIRLPKLEVAQPRRITVKSAHM